MFKFKRTVYLRPVKRNERKCINTTCEKVCLLSNGRHTCPKATFTYNNAPFEEEKKNLREKLKWVWQDIQIRFNFAKLG